MSRQRLWLESFASTAPALGVLGTYIAIWASFYRWGDVNDPIRHSAEQFGISLMTTALGLAAGVIAQVVRYYVRSRIGQLVLKSTYDLATPVSSQQRRAKRFPLQVRLSQLPTFPIMAAPSLVLILAGFMPSDVSKGFLVHLARPTVLAAENSQAVPPIEIAIAQDPNGERGIVYLNRKPIPTGTLQEMLRSGQAISNPTVHLQAEDNVQWREVVHAIDAAENVSRNVLLLTAR